MPMVVKTAIVEQAMSSHSMTRLDAVAGAQLGRDARPRSEEDGAGCDGSPSPPGPPARDAA